MLEAIELLKVEIEKIGELAAALRQAELSFRAKYREREARRLRVILDMFENV